MRLSDPLSREESRQGDVLPQGIYPFDVVEATDSRSKSGNEMIKVRLRIHTPEGKQRILYDYLLEAMKFKLAHFFEAIGKWDVYERHEFSADDCYGSGSLKLIIQEAKDGYAAKNSVDDYILTDEQEASKSERKRKAAQQSPDEDPDFDDSDTPF